MKKVSKSEEAFKKTEQKVDTAFAAGYGTILFYEDRTAVNELQAKFPSLPGKFGLWSEHSSAIVQILTWMGLESVGLGASIQHYNPLIDDAIKDEWNINKDWLLIAQMPFGEPAGEPVEKTHLPVDERLVVIS